MNNNSTVTMDRVTNLTFLKSFTGNNPKRMLKMMDLFLQTIPEELDQIRDYHHKKDWESLKVTIHGMKPKLTYMGMEGIKETVVLAERYTGEQVRLEDIPSLLEKIISFCKLAIEELEIEKASIAKP